MLARKAWPVPDIAIDRPQVARARRPAPNKYLNHPAAGRTIERELSMRQDDKPPVPPELLAKVSDLANLVDYQQGAVVSRTIINKKTGTVTLFAFDEGQGLSEHTAPFDALVYLLDGRGEVSISGKPLELGRGDMVIMPANEPHALKAADRFKMMLVMIKS